MFTSRIKITLYFVLIISGLLLISSCGKNRTPIAFELPMGFSGWVTVRFEKPNAPPLVETDGFYHIKISDSGFAETSSKVQDGWAEDKYYWIDGSVEHQLPKYHTDYNTMIHAETYGTADPGDFIKTDTLQIGKEYTLYDGSKYTKLEDKGGMSYKSGRYLLFICFVSQKPENIWDFPKTLPPIPPNHKKW